MKKFPFGFNLLYKFILVLSDKYFSSEVLGLENIPHGPCLLVGNHNAIAVVNPEIWIFGSRYFTYFKNLSVLGHDLISKIPVVSYIATHYLRFIPNNMISAQKALELGNHVLVYPGGGWESCRPSCDRDIINFKDRVGFVQLVKRAKVPIIPIVSIGAHDGIYIWKRGARLAKLFRLDRIFRIDTFPLGFSFPFIFHIGPLFPFIPLPRKVILEIGKPIYYQDLKDLEDDVCARKIESIMQETLDKNVLNLPRSRKIAR